MDPGHASGRGIDRALHQVLLDRLARPFGIGMEGHQPLGLLPVAEPVLYDGTHGCLVVGIGRQHGLEFRPEGEAPDIVQQCADALAALTLVDELEQFLEHTGRCTRSWHEFHDIQTVGFAFVTRHGGGSLRVAHDHHPVAGRCGAHNLQEGEPAAEILQLALDRIGGQPVFFDLL